MELTAVAIAYNTGNFIPSKGLMQGHFDGHKFYGEHIFEFIRMAHTVPVPGGSPILPPPPPDGAIVPPPTPVEATGPFLVVDTQLSPLRVRSAPKISSPPTANVIAELPDGHPVRAITGNPVKNFIEIETSLAGAHIRGFASADFLVAAPADVTEIPVGAVDDGRAHERHRRSLHAAPAGPDHQADGDRRRPFAQRARHAGPQGRDARRTARPASTRSSTISLPTRRRTSATSRATA